MNILFFTQNYPKSYNEAIVSGMVKNPFHLSQYLKKSSHNIKIITYGKEKGVWNFEGVKVYSIGKGILKGVIKAFFLDIGMTRCFFKLHREEKIDVIHIHSGNLIFLFLLKKIGRIKTPIIYSAHGTSTPELRANIQGKKSFFNFLLLINGKIQEKIDKFMWKNSDMLVSGSNYQIKEMTEIYEVPEEKIKHIYNGVDSARYFSGNNDGRELRVSLGISDQFPVILYVGRIARKKGIDFLIRALKSVLKEFPNVCLVLVLGSLGGQRDYKKEVLSLIKEENLEKCIIIKEDVSEKELPRYYNMADVCVFPSTGYESIPTVIYEAMVCGKPIITQGSWGTVEVLNDILLSEEEIMSGALQNRILEILKDGELQERLTKEGIEKSKEFYWSKIVIQYISLYEKLF